MTPQIDKKTSAKTSPVILGIESSCDETAAAIVSADHQILSNIIASSSAIHAQHGGVVPEIAARAHLDTLGPVITKALASANMSIEEIDGIAATGGPGLIGGVLVGTVAAKAIAQFHDKPYFAINHLEGHALTARLTDKVDFPYLLLLVSGGHSQILLVRDVGDYQRLGTTMDDAAGELFDKSAKVLGLGYPGGPAIEQAARDGNAKAISLPRPLKGADHCHFSFSGLKTALAQSFEKYGDQYSLSDYAASLQSAITDCMADRVENALTKALQHDDFAANRTLVVAGGVAANKAISEKLQEITSRYDVRLIVPPAALCTDNAAMIAWAGVEYFQRQQPSSLAFAPRPRWPLDDTAPPPPGRGVRP
ncbi:MAG: tRNA (adenosine(37)-N6)-threonylcarbamoyltransferase complex transferase subunit TsaD [Candidatus Puniceispirillaceae bacterium]